MSKRGTGFKDLTGQRFGRLVVRCIDEERTYPKHIYWLCDCDCGNEKSVSRDKLMSGNTQSCGCLRSERIKKTKTKMNKYDLSGEYGIGWTCNTNEEFYFDLEDYDKIKNYCWIVVNKKGNYKALETTFRVDNKESQQKMHTVITNEKNLDHINRNPLDNRKENLRQATKRENNINHNVKSNSKTGISGVYYDVHKDKWVANISVEPYKKTVVYRGDNLEEAIKARLKAEKEYYGEFAPQQHLYEQYGIA